MNRKLIIGLAALGSAFLIATGAAAGILIAGSGDDANGDETRPAARTAQTGSATGKGYLGLTVSLSTPGTGLRVATIESDGPADEAGLSVGDVIRAVNEDVVRTPEKLRSIVEAKKPGETVTVTYERGDRIRQVPLILGNAPAEVEIESVPGAPFSNLLVNRVRLGVRIQQIDRETMERLSLQRDEGVVVIEITPGSAAERAGLQPNDIFISVNGTSVDTIDELQRAITATPANRLAEMRILRGSQELTLSTNLAPLLSLEGLGSDLLPPQVRERLLQQLERGEINQQQLQQILRLYRSRTENVRVGTVADATATELKLKLVSGEDITMALNGQTQLRRGRDVIRPADLRDGELVMVLSMDGGETAFSVNGFGVLDLP
jgi:membrane-associated protease RseP (regulator of RpoE activity)